MGVRTGCINVVERTNLVFFGGVFPPISQGDCISGRFWIDVKRNSSNKGRYL